jgi:carboxypeptidase family protein/putative Ig domain-containing protein
MVFRVHRRFASPGLSWLPTVGLLAGLACGDPHTPDVTTGTLAGVVQDAETDTPIEGVTLVVAGIQGLTGSDGRFEIDSVPEGTQQVAATMAGYVPQTVDVQIQANAIASLSLELVADPNPSSLRITTSTLPTATVDVPYEALLEATGGTPPYEWRASHPPPGLGVTGDGLVSGSPGFPAGAYTFGVSVRDAESTLVSAELTLEIRTTSGLRALGEELSTGEAGVPYADTLRAQGGAPPYVFELAGLPEGLQLDPATGVVSGTPQGATGAEGEPIELELVVRDVVGASAFDSVSIGIVPGPVVITSDLPDGQVGVFYEAFLEHTGGFGTFDEYTVISGSLPPGLGLAGPESLFGSRLDGTPILAGTYQFTLQLSLCATNRPGECTPQIATREYVVVIAGSPLSIVTSSLPDAVVGTPYSVFLVREGGSGPFQWDVVSGSLPAGISLTAAGELTGTPTAPGDASFEVRVQDAGDQSATANLALHVEP